MKSILIMVLGVLMFAPSMALSTSAMNINAPAAHINDLAGVYDEGMARYQFLRNQIKEIPGDELSQLKMRLFNANRNGSYTELMSAYNELVSLSSDFNAAAFKSQQATALDRPNFAPMSTGEDMCGFGWSDEEPYNWITASNSLNLSGDDGTTYVQLPWAYPMYGNTYTYATVSTNGVVYLTNSAQTNNAQYSNYCLPYSISSYTNTPVIYTYWDDLYMPSSMTYQNYGSYFVIIWNGYRLGGDTGSEPRILELILYQEGGFTIQFQNVSSTGSYTNNETIGCQDMYSTGPSCYWQYRCNQNPAQTTNFRVDWNAVLAPQIDCDVAADVQSPAANSAILVGNSVSIIGTFENRGLVVQSNIPVFARVEDEDGNTLENYEGFIGNLAPDGSVNVNFGSFTPLEPWINYTVIIWHELPCDNYWDPDYEDYYIRNNSSESSFYVYAAAENNNCETARVLVPGERELGYTFGATNNFQFTYYGYDQTSLTGYNPDVWFKFTAPENGSGQFYLWQSAYQPTYQYVGIFACFMGSPYFVTCDIDPLEYWYAYNGWWYTTMSGSGYGMDNYYLFEDQTLYIIVQQYNSSSSYAREFFFDYQFNWSPLAPSNIYRGNDNCASAYEIDDCSDEVVVQASTQGGDNDFWFQTQQSPTTVCAGSSINGPPSASSWPEFYAGYASDVVFEIPLYEGGSMEAAAVSIGNNNFYNYYMTMMLLRRCRSGIVDEVCEDGASQNSSGPSVSYGPVPDDGDDWPEEQVNMWLVVDSYYYYPYDYWGWQGDFELTVEKEIPCHCYTDAIDIELWTDGRYVYSGQLVNILDQSKSPCAQADLGDADYRMWFSITERQMRNYLIYLSETYPKYAPLNIYGYEAVRIDPTIEEPYKASTNIIYVPEWMLMDVVVSPTYRIDKLGLNTINWNEFFFETTYIVLGMSCTGCPGYNYTYLTIEVTDESPVPCFDSEIKIYQIIDEVPYEAGTQIAINPGEAVDLESRFECTPCNTWDDPGIIYTWYVNTREQNLPNWNTRNVETQIFAPTLLIACGRYSPDPGMTGCTVCDQVWIIPSAAKGDVAVTEKLEPGELKVAKAKFTGGLESFAVRYLPESAISSATLRIYDLKGRMVRELAMTITDEVNGSWDGKDSAGNLLPSGTYVWQLNDGHKTQSGVTVLAR